MTTPIIKVCGTVLPTSRWCVGKWGGWVVGEAAFNREEISGLEYHR